jgi:arginine:ornithine antiporter/lysine permease
MCAILFAPGIVVYVKARRERGERAFNGIEIAIAVGIAALALLAAWLMWTGRISPL